MRTNEELKEQLSNLQNAIAEGALEVEFQGKKIKYRTLDEMRRIELGLMQELTGKSGAGFKKIVSVFEKF
ncbi:MAG: hypothetical protein V4591_05135 [Bdellovibrionota bacterium]